MSYTSTQTKTQKYLWRKLKINSTGNALKLKMYSNPICTQDSKCPHALNQLKAQNVLKPKTNSGIKVFLHSKSKKYSKYTQNSKCTKNTERPRKSFVLRFTKTESASNSLGFTRLKLKMTQWPRAQSNSNSHMSLNPRD